MFVCKNQNYLKNKAEIKNHKKIKTKGRRLRKKDLGKIKWDAASVPHDKCREDYAATHVTRQKDRGIELRGKILKILRGKKEKEKGRRKFTSSNATIKKNREKLINGTK